MKIEYHAEDYLKLDLYEKVFVIELLKDMNLLRAARASGIPQAVAKEVYARERVQESIQQCLARRAEQTNIDATWLLFEAVDNHRIARQEGNLSASNQALNLIARHVAVDAMATQKLDLDVTVDREIIARLQRGRERVAERRGRTLEHGESHQQPEALEHAAEPSFV